MRCTIAHNNRWQEESTATLRYTGCNQQNKTYRPFAFLSRNTSSIKHCWWPFITQKEEKWIKKEPVINLLAEKLLVSTSQHWSFPLWLSFPTAPGCLGSSDLLHILSSGLLNTPANICQTKAVKCFLCPCQSVWLPLVCFSIFFTVVFHHDSLF